jgi:hypothetical protein
VTARRKVALAALALLATALPARADAVLDALRAEAARAEKVGFERTTRTVRQTDDGPRTSVQVDRFNPRAPASQQWTLLSVDGRAPTRREIAEHRKLVNALPVPGFYRLSAILAGEPSRSTDASGRTVYRWNSLPPRSMPTPGPDVSQRMAAEAVVEQVRGKPVLTSVRLFAPRPFPVMAVAKVNSFDLMNHYAEGSSGTPMLVSQTSSTDIAAPFGQGGRQQSQVNFRPLTP